MARMKRLVLIGGGHAHVEVLRRFGIHPLPDTELVLVSPQTHTPYSGMLPGWIAGHYSRAQCHIDLARLCGKVNARLVLSRSIGVNPDARLVFCYNGENLDYDLASVDTGGLSPAFDTPGALTHALSVKPIEDFVARWEELCQSAARGRVPNRVAMVGAGAAGVEVLLAMHYRLEQLAPGNAVHYVLVSDSAEFLPTHNASARQHIGEILRRRGIKPELGRKVERVDQGVLRCRDGGLIHADLIVWATGASAPWWPRAVGLATDEHGFILVNEQLQSVSHPTLFAAGDIATVHHRPRPKSGVYAVRAGPPLAENLRRALYSHPLTRWKPQAQSLALISTGGRHAVASRGRFALQGDWVWRWKDWLDRGFMRRYET